MHFLTNHTAEDCAAMVEICAYEFSDNAVGYTVFESLGYNVINFLNWLTG